MLSNFIDRVGDINPQLFRELKGRLTQRNLVGSILVSILMQTVILFNFYTQLPVKNLTEVPYLYNQYCLSYNPTQSQCILDSSGNIIINWPHWWHSVLMSLSWWIPLGLIIGVVYSLTIDLNQEKKTKTIDFIKLTPQSSYQIFLGKILGVPIVTYLWTIAMLPLHLITGINAHSSLINLWLWYVLIGSLIWFLSSLIILFSSNPLISPALFYTIALTLLSALPIHVINWYLSVVTQKNTDYQLITEKHNITWFNLPITSNINLFYLWTIALLLIASYYLWIAIDRRYINPHLTIINKIQSYQINLSLQVLILGFCWHSYTQIPTKDNNDLFPNSNWTFIAFNSMMILTLNIGWIYLLFNMLIPQSQSLIDWEKYRQPKNLIKDLIKHEQSTVILAIAINALIISAIWLPLIIYQAYLFVSIVKLIIMVAMTITLLLIHFTLLQISHISQHKLEQIKINIWNICLFFSPIIMVAIIAKYFYSQVLINHVLLFSVLMFFVGDQVSSIALILSFTAQLYLLSQSLNYLHKQMKKVAQTTPKLLSTS